MPHTTHLENPQACRKVCWPIYVFVSLLTLLLAAPSLRGQETYDASARWAVLDFDSAPGDATTGQTATDNVVEEMNLLNKYDIPGRPDVQAALQLLGLTLPLNTTGERRLGRLLGANAIVTGSVGSITFLGTRAQVVLTIKVRDVRTGELINGAWVTGESDPKSTAAADPESLVSEAITNAAYTAVGQMAQYALPHATVLIREDSHTVLLSQGTQDGLRPGLSMVVTRFGGRIGLLKLTRVEADQAEAQVVQEGGGIAAQDIATVIYTLPASPTH